MKNRESLQNRLNNLKGKNGHISRKMTALIFALLILGNSTITALTEEINAVDGSLPDEIIFIDDDASPAIDNSDTPDDNQESEIVNGDMPVLVDENMPVFNDVSNNDQIASRANYIYSRYSNDLGGLSIDEKFIQDLIKLFNSRNPFESGDVTNQNFLPYMQTYIDLFTRYIKEATDYYNGTSKNKPPYPTIPISAYADEDVMGINITKSLEYYINGMLSAKSKKEAKPFVKGYADIIFYSFYLNGVNGYPSHYLVGSSGVRLLNILTILEAQPLALSICDPILKYDGLVDGESVRCTIRLSELMEKINFQECPITDANRNIMNDAIIGTMAEANQSAYTYK